MNSLDVEDHEITKESILLSAVVYHSIMANYDKRCIRCCHVPML